MKKMIASVRIRFLPKAACRRVAVTPPPPASRRSGGGGVTAYMPGKLADGREEETQERKTQSAGKEERAWFGCVGVMAQNP